MNQAPVYGLWGLVIINSVVFILFAFSFFKPRTSRDWRSFGAFSAFLVALFAEMYGFPLTIYLLSGWLSQHYPGVDVFPHEAGHLWHTLLGLHGDPHFESMHILSMVFIVGGFWLLASAWPVLYAAQRRGALATTGPYARLRHPQYAAFMLIMLGFLLQWPTLPTLVMFPVLIFMYLRLARHEEQESLTRFGKVYAGYRAQTPAFLPRPGRRAPSDRNHRGAEQAGEAARRETWHDRPIEAVAAQLDAALANGLSSEEALRRLAEHGRNELRKGKGVSALALLAGQFKSLVIWVLIGAAAVSMALEELADGTAIIAIVILNAVIGFLQEYRAEKAAAALARLAAPHCRVMRGGHSMVVTATEIVPGDILLLEGGDLVAADARLIQASVLRINEAPLTGESQAVGKFTGDLPSETPLADRKNMVFLGTSVTGGAGRALVVNTGMETELGHIAKLLETAESGETPLQRQLDRVARLLLWACFGIVALIFSLGLLRGIAPFELFLSAVSLAVAAIPEGLPAVVTVALALGVQRMVQRHALVRRLASVETLGRAQVICTDKTGTLTMGEMTARKLIASENLYRVTGEGYATEGAFFSGNVESLPSKSPGLLALLRASVACNDAELNLIDDRPAVVGDPTEGALLVAAEKGGITRAAIEAEMPRLATVPFDSDRKLMTLIRSQENRPWAFVKGAPEVILSRCTLIRTEQGIRELTESDRTRLLDANTLLAQDALRVLAVAERPLDDFKFEECVAVNDTAIEQGLTLLGLVGLQDPPRGEAKEAVVKCIRAGIKTVMITGDHPDTARAIGHELGILGKGDEVLVGAELDRLNDEALKERVAHVSVYARVTAEHKLRIVRAWKAQGAVVAMTGDGVNDAPAIKEASIGIAMGITGTEVTKEAADIIITDDNFASIVAAVEEGRGIYDNIAKTLAYLLSGNTGELIVMLSAVLLGWPLPLLPLHLLWINLVTDGLPALALATDPIDPGVLNRPPRHAQEPLFNRDFLKLTLFTGLLTAGVTLGVFAYELYINNSLEQARDAAFTALVIAELVRAFGARSNHRTVWQMGLFTNLRLFLIVTASFALQLAIHHVPLLQTLFGIEPVTLNQCAAWFGLGFIPLLTLEALKLWRQYRERHAMRTPAPTGSPRP